MSNKTQKVAIIGSQGVGHKAAQAVINEVQPLTAAQFLEQRYEERKAEAIDRVKQQGRTANNYHAKTKKIPNALQGIKQSIKQAQRMKNGDLVSTLHRLQKKMRKDLKFYTAQYKYYTTLYNKACRNLERLEVMKATLENATTGEASRIAAIEMAMK